MIDKLKKLFLNILMVFFLGVLVLFFLISCKAFERIFVGSSYDTKTYVELGTVNSGGWVFNKLPYNTNKYYFIEVENGKIDDYKYIKKLPIFLSFETSNLYDYIGVYDVYIYDYANYIKYSDVKEYIVGEKPNKNNAETIKFTELPHDFTTYQSNNKKEIMIYYYERKKELNYGVV